MKKTCLLLFLLLHIAAAVGAQTLQSSPTTYQAYFQEIEAATQEYRQLWGRDLYSSILLVDPQTRYTIANEADTAGVLRKAGDVFAGYLPPQVNLANTALRWGGKHWAMLLLPLPEDRHERVSLLAHELFHKAQPSLGFALYNPENKHLDQKKGRIYLRLELEALKKAVQASSEDERKALLTHALTFRKYRHQLYPGADSTENLLELNEGLAAYTGLVVSNRSKKEAAAHFVSTINAFLSDPTFVRSFAYQTTPIYGYLLRDKQKDWNRGIAAATNLTDYFARALQINVPRDLKSASERTAGTYGGNAIIAEETKREEEKRKLLSDYKRRFVEQPRVEIGLEEMSVSFDPRNIVPLEDLGTVYPTIRVTDNWGILTVEKGALMSPDWKKIFLPLPTSIDEDEVSGEGWTLELNSGYRLIKESSSGGYKLRRK
ncbi:hypothetical protein CLV24_1604 [Pontibacter ummariensis]|uniref:Peptidase MA superfamily protein n=1 Tax=Pontibacter ummariensis TaxID=1610492 RepID=A0A239M1W5_9BACT|nr:hypothetical protein [Pontibacter ummariensis]PRX99276.1 hypothetical protein CLV24_1604 [Pontibacter ummariensis]SNT35909.1 hypothetical protein SAMN06296052_1614 [Pontibacter ummariensis]